MPRLIIWKDEEIIKIKRDLDRLMSRFRDDLDTCFISRPVRRISSFKLSETNDTLIFRAALPGVDPHTLHVSVSDEKILTIRGISKEIETSEAELDMRLQKHKSVFSRSFQLPCRIRVEEADAVYQDGVLTLTMPKHTTEREREIFIRIENARNGT